MKTKPVPVDLEKVFDYDYALTALYRELYLRAVDDHTEIAQNGRRIVLERGQVVFSYRTFAEYLGWSHMKVKRVFDNLVSFSSGPFYRFMGWSEDELKKQKLLHLLLHWPVAGFTLVHLQFYNLHFDSVTLSVTVPRENVTVKEKYNSSIVKYRGIFKKAMQAVFRKKQRTEVDDVFDKYVESRRALRRPLTFYAKELIWEDLEKLAPKNPVMKIQILKQSIKKGYMGVFPLKEEFLRDASLTEVFQPGRKSIY